MRTQSQAAFPLAKKVEGLILACYKIILQMTKEEVKGIIISSLSSKHAEELGIENIDLSQSYLKKVLRSQLVFPPLSGSVLCSLWW